MTEATISNLVAARICHDLVSPIGAIENAIDLMAEFADADTSEEQAILRQSARRGAALLRYYRLAFGNLPDSESALARPELVARIEAVLAGPRVEMRWTGTEGPPLPLRAARALKLMTLVARSALGMTGRLTITLPIEGGLPLGVGAEGERARLGEAEAAWLAETSDEMPEPRQVEFLLLPLALRQMGGRLTVRAAPGSVLLTALPE